MSASPQLDDLRRSLQERGVHRDELAPDPFTEFGRWFELARGSGMHEPEAMVVSTVDEQGQPSSRHVLLKGVDTGFVFYTNRRSQKGRELGATPRAALCFTWHVLSRQVRVEGPVEEVADALSDAYFASRPRGSQISASASPQSAVVADRTELEAQVAELERRYEGRDVPRPAHWGGYRVVPTRVELWQGRASRLHDRFRYTADDAEPGGWRIERLGP